MFSSLKVRNFRIYWFGMLVSLIGTWIQTITQSWLVFDLTNSAFLLGMVGFLGSIPIFLLSLFGGVMADRMNKRTILIITQTIFMLLAFSLGVLTQLKIIAPWQIMMLAVLNGTVMAFDAPSRQSMVVELVGKSHLLNAIALNSVSFNSARIIGPALAGILVANIGMSGCFYLNGLSFLAVIAALFLIKINTAPRENKRGGALRDLKAGLVFIRQHRIILLLVAMVGMFSLFGFSYVILMPVIANNMLGAGVKGLAWLMSSAGLGALIAALALARLGDYKYKGRLLSIAVIVFSLALILFGLSKSYFFSLMILILIGATGVGATAIINTLLQTNVPDEFRGRVMSVFMLTFAGFLPFGSLIAGALAEALGVSATIVTGGVVCAVFFITINFLYPEIRRI